MLSAERSETAGDLRADAQRKRDAFETLRPVLLRAAAGILKDRHAAEDCVQVAFLRCHVRDDRVDAGRLRGWWLKVVANEALAQKRRRKEQPAEGLEWLVDAVGEDALVRAERVAAVRQALDRLPSEVAEVVRLRVYEARTFAVIAEDLELPLGTVLTRMRRGMRLLRDELSEHG